MLTLFKPTFETTSVLPYRCVAQHGEDVAFQMAFTVNGLSTDELGDYTWGAYYQDPRNLSDYYEIDSSDVEYYDGDNTIYLYFRPKYDLGAPAYRIFLRGEQGTETCIPALIELAMAPNPFFHGSPVVPVPPTLDFSQYELINAPWTPLSVFEDHVEDTTAHVTIYDRDLWNTVSEKADLSALKSYVPLSGTATISGDINLRANQNSDGDPNVKPTIHLTVEDSNIGGWIQLVGANNGQTLVLAADENENYVGRPGQAQWTQFKWPLSSGRLVVDSEISTLVAGKADVSATVLRATENFTPWTFPDFDTHTGEDPEYRAVTTETALGYSLEIDARDWDYEEGRYGEWYVLDSCDEYAPLTATSFTWSSDHGGEIVYYYGERTSSGKYYVLGDQITAHLADVDELSNYATTTDVENAISTLSGSIAQSDWAETNTSSKAFILNKPTVLPVTSDNYGNYNCTSAVQELIVANSNQTKFAYLYAPQSDSNTWPGIVATDGYLVGTKLIKHTVPINASNALIIPLPGKTDDAIARTSDLPDYETWTFVLSGGTSVTKKVAIYA